MADLKSGCRLSHPEKHAKVSWDYHIDLWLRRRKKRIRLDVSHLT